MDDPDARPEISSEAISISEYAVLYLGYPIWHGQAPRILSTFAESYDFDGERFSAGAARETLADWIDGLALEAAGQ